MLDLDIILWTGGRFASHGMQQTGHGVPARAARGLLIPHAMFRQRAFVLGPAAQLAPEWRDPLTGLTLRQLHARLTRHRPLPR